MGLLYYISNVRSSPTIQDLKEVGLDGQIVGGFCTTEIFIDGSKGAVFCLNGKSSGKEKIGFYVDDQKWVNIPKEDGAPSRLWIGYDLNNKPNPKDFLRKDFINGTPILLGDDQEWLIPIAIKFENNICALPKSIVQYRENSEPEFVVVGKFLQLKVIADKMAELFGLFDNGKQSEYAEFYKFYKNQIPVCAKILSYNYNLSMMDISVLGLFTTENTIKIMKEVVDGSFIEIQERQMKEQLEKEEKKKSEGSTDGN